MEAITARILVAILAMVVESLVYMHYVLEPKKKSKEQKLGNHGGHATEQSLPLKQTSKTLN